jgi:glutamate 5-kinase
MASKLKAAQFVTQSGSPVIIAGGRAENVLTRLVGGEELGTVFLPQQRGLAPKKRWIGFSAHASGIIHVDAGAARALRSSGPSLLAIGICRVEGVFAKGEVISIVDEQGQEIARGLTNYDSRELERIRGLRSPGIAEVLGHCPYEEVVHRDNMTIVGLAALSEDAS